MTIKSKLFNLEQIVSENMFFYVPKYQRLYVWGIDQVKTLLEDLWRACEDEKDIFYFGGTLVLERNDNGSAYLELIDGQQRFTTLWMLSIILQENLAPFIQTDKSPRITFAIRPEVDEFFKQLMADRESAKEIQNTNILDALAAIDTFISEKSQQCNKDKKEIKREFSEFIYKKVQLVQTRVSGKTDLNKLFEVINNRGIQLLHHQILKAWMLQLSEPEKRTAFARIWEACSIMDGYIEKNIRDVLRQEHNIPSIKIDALFDPEKSRTDQEDLSRADAILEKLYEIDTKKEGEARSLEDILTKGYSDETPVKGNGEKTDPDEYETDTVRSIISFPMLLQHTLRIWLHTKEKNDLPKILDKELLGLFQDHFFAALHKEKPHDDVESFIKLLWEIRYLFDKHIIKWVVVGREEHHLISKMTLPDGRIQRNKPSSTKGFPLLQSMLYHSQEITTQYWLTPLLSYMLHHRENRDQYFKFLRHLDNHLFCAENPHHRPLVSRSFDFVGYPWKKNKILDIEALLSQNLGTGFPRYWFYKLEFILWYCWKEYFGFGTKEQDQKQKQKKSFRITAKNSVEHISPQNPWNKRDIVSDNVLDTFGNLALVSRSINSEYGNKPFTEKRERFKNRNTDRLDSLKMALIYQNEEWNDKLSLSHRGQMIELILCYCHHEKCACPEGL